MDRQIAYFQIPAFEIALARRHDSALRHWPVAIAPTHSARAYLREVSREASDDGLRPGMSVETARRLCPALHLLPSDPLRIDTAQRNLERIVAEFAPVWEPVHPGHLFLDLTGTRRLLGPAIDAAVRIEREIIRREQLAGVLGVGTNKFVSRMAATVVHPPELCEVRPGLESNFLSPLHVSLLPRLPESSTKQTLALLDDLNLHTLGAIAETSLPHLELVLGPSAARLHEWARGVDPSPVLPAIQHPNVERSIVISPDEIDDAQLLNSLYHLLEHLCRTLRAQGRVCRRLHLTVRHSDHVDVSKHQCLDPGTWWESDVYPHLKDLFFRCFRRRVRLRTMTIRVDHLEPPTNQWGAQLSLFDDERLKASVQHERAHRLTLALDRLRARFGEQAIQRGHITPLKKRAECRPSQDYS
jgi:DNA polymerase IV